MCSQRRGRLSINKEDHYSNLTQREKKHISVALDLLRERGYGRGAPNNLNMEVEKLYEKLQVIENPVHHLTDDGDGGVTAPCGAFDNRGEGKGSTNAQEVTCPECLQFCRKKGSK
jgi:hypothetical protein